MAVIHVTKETFENEVLKSPQAVLLDFWATWCGPCKMIAPILEEAAQKRQDVKVCKVDVDKEAELSVLYGITSIPTLMLFQNGELVRKTVGAMSLDQLLSFIDG